MNRPLLSHRIYTRSTLEIARRLLGCLLVTKQGAVVTSGRIVETEAYHGDIDPACHCYHRRTPRNEVMFHRAGTYYVYRIYGIHNCFNLVTEELETGAAVLIRAVEPVTGISTMQQRRSISSLRELSNGPGKLCQALAIEPRHSGLHVDSCNEIWIETERPIPDSKITATTRVGISKAQQLPWRFYISASPYVSRRETTRE